MEIVELFRTPEGDVVLNHPRSEWLTAAAKDCTTTQVSGCSDMVQGWVDSVGRDCPTYVTWALQIEGMVGGAGDY